MLNMPAPPDPDLEGEAVKIWLAPSIEANVRGVLDGDVYRLRKKREIKSMMLNQRRLHVSLHVRHED